MATWPDSGPTPPIHRERSFTDATLYTDLAACGDLPTRIGYRAHLSRWADAAEEPGRDAPNGLIACLGLKELIDDGRYSAPGMDFGYEFRYAGRETVLEWMHAADGAGLSVTLHALGDLAVTEALDLFEHVQHNEPSRPRRPRLVHARRVAPDDIPRIARLGVVVEAQPWDFLSGMPRLAAAGDEAFVSTTSPFRSLLDAQARLVFSSDWRISPQRPDGLDMDPLVGVFAAVTRQSPLGGAVWSPEQRLSVGEALEAYTSTAAWAGFAEHHRGAIEPGREADLVVLSRDIVAEADAPHALLEAQVLLTIVGGRVVYARDDAHATCP
jgi:predicted amidohydrolase YtcJ